MIFVVKYLDDSQRFFHSSSLCYVGFSSYHGLSHASDVLGPHILRRVHLTVINDSLPWVASILGSLLAILVVFSLLLIHLDPPRYLSFSLFFPLVEGLLPCHFPCIFFLLFLLHFLEQFSLSFLLLLLDPSYNSDFLLC